MFVNRDALKISSEPNRDKPVQWLQTIRKRIREDLLGQAVPQVFKAFSLFADGTAARRLKVGELLEFLSVYFVGFLTAKQTQSVNTRKSNPTQSQTIADQWLILMQRLTNQVWPYTSLKMSYLRRVNVFSNSQWTTTLWNLVWAPCGPLQCFCAGLYSILQFLRICAFPLH